MKFMDLFSTRMSGKMKGIISLNTSPLDNSFCNTMSKTETSICSHCYSRSMLKGIRRNALPKFQRVGAIISKEMDSLPKIPAKYKIARFSAHGELMNLMHLVNLYRIAKANPHVLFALWSKRKDLIAKEKAPSNVIKVYSNPKTNSLMKSPPKGFHKVFNVFSKEYVKDNAIQINCQKSCLSCQLCYSWNNVKVINEQLK